MVRVRQAQGDTFIKLKEGLARRLYEELDGDERCSAEGHCRRRGEQIICSSENLRDPFVCELHLAQGDWLAPRDDWELYHSAEDNRRFGVATAEGGLLRVDGEAGQALGAQLGLDAPVVLELLLPEGTVGPSAQ